MFYICLLLDTEKFESNQQWQPGGFNKPRMGEARSYSVDEGGGRTIPIKVESSAQPRVFSPHSRSLSIDQQASYRHDGTPPSKSFGVRQTEPLREIPVRIEKKTDENLRQIPISIESVGKYSPRQLHIERERDDHQQRQVPVERDGAPRGFYSDSYDKKSDRFREIPIKRELKQEPIEAPNPFRRETLASEHKPPASYHTDLTDTYDERVLQNEEKHKAELKRKQMELKRDIDNVIFEAIQQVPIQRQTKSELETKPGERYPRQASVDEMITASKKEDPRQQRVDQVLQQTVDKDQKNLIQQRWEQEQRQKEEKEKWKAAEVGSYATLPIKKQSSVDVTPIEQEAGSYSTLPSYKLRISKTSGSPKALRSYSHDPDRHYFSDAETTRRTPTWRPVASPLAKRSTKQMATASGVRDVWTPPGIEKRTWSPAQPPASSQAYVDFKPTKGRSMHAAADAHQPA